MTQFTVIVEYWRDDLQQPSIETTKRRSRLSAMYVCRKRLKTAWQRPGYIPDCARVEDANEQIVAVYKIDSDGQPILCDDR